MIPVDQTRFWVPEKSHGNCQQAAVASILELPLDTVPNFIEQAAGFWPSYWAFIKKAGFQILELSGNHAPDCFYLASGESLRGVGHTVVFRDGKLAHDPHFSRGGLVKVDYIHVLIPLELSRAVIREAL